MDLNPKICTSSITNSIFLELKAQKQVREIGIWEWLWIGVVLVRNYGLWRRRLWFGPQAGLLFGPKGPSEAETHDTNTIATCKAKRCFRRRAINQLSQVFILLVSTTGEW